MARRAPRAGSRRPACRRRGRRALAVPRALARPPQRDSRPMPAVPRGARPACLELDIDLVLTLAGGPVREGGREASPARSPRRERLGARERPSPRRGRRARDARAHCAAYPPDSAHRERRAVLKLETLQRGGSFKVRGAAAAITTATAPAEIVAASTGNHALAVATVAAELGIPWPHLRAGERCSGEACTAARGRRRRHARRGRPARRRARGAPLGPRTRPAHCSSRRTTTAM